jgi:uncharacterized Zn-finger protein
MNPPYPEPIESDQATVYCQGGASSEGHPKVYLELPIHGLATCPYCSQSFKHKGSS